MYSPKVATYASRLLKNINFISIQGCTFSGLISDVFTSTPLKTIFEISFGGCMSSVFMRDSDFQKKSLYNFRLFR